MPIINLLKTIKNKYFIRKIEDSAKYHLSNVFASNLVLSLLDISARYLESLGLNENDALDALFPLIEGNIESIHKNGFVNSLTGPVARGDIETVKKHIEVLNNEDKCLYNLLSLNLLKLVEKRDSNIKMEETCSFEGMDISRDKNLKKENALNISEKYKDLFKLLGGEE
ncbi:DUF2520 domain-containing protein [Clostridium sp. BJN0001]|uniref:DUF2520 domain-containing protein n=1 Tax=Clostridium sp. BJN0001 TaxID=2930219 RepID=UPI001FD4947B|nr:DUF2520 domain-containing protein [Clostridium sp. BJN0001]